MHVDELLRVPFPLPEQLNDSRQGMRIVEEVCEIVEASYDEAEKSFLSRENTIAVASERIEPLVNAYFDIHPLDEVLIADTIGVVAPSAQPRPEQKTAPSLATGSSAEAASYVERLCATLNQWAAPSGNEVRGSCTISGSLGVGVAILQKARLDEEKGSLRVGQDLVRVLRRIRDALAVDGGSLSAHREVMVFEGDKLYLLKPAARVHWTATAALNDADALATKLLFSKTR